MKAFELQVDFFLPLWRRVAVVVVCAVWSIFEFFAMAPFWGFVAAAMGLYCVWQFFFDGWPEKQPITAYKNTSDRVDAE